jgi:hypothetical protein
MKASFNDNINGAKAAILLCSLSCLSIYLSGCKGNDPVKIAPGNLTATTNITTDGSGLVTFHAAADNAASYTFYFGEGANDPFASTDGNATHTYGSMGTFSTKIVAVSKDNLSVEKILDVTLVEPPVPTAGYTSPASYAGMTLVWQDEFNGSVLNASDWNYETGPYNDELQYYQKQNTSVLDGYLIIKARQEKAGSQLYTSSRLNTQNKKSFTYGRIDIRALMPKGRGLFPALWMLGTSISSVGWPKCGETDIMETIGGGGRDSVVYGTTQWEFNGAPVSYGGHKGLQDGHVLGDQFHVYSIAWTSTTIKWYLDDKLYHTIDITPADLAPFQKEFFFIFNVAVGGAWAGAPDATTVWPQRMVVDYVRVFQ